MDPAPPAPLLLGRHVLALGMKPGPAVGEILRQVYEKQLDGDVRTTEDAIALARQLGRQLAPRRGHRHNPPHCSTGQP